MWCSRLPSAGAAASGAADRPEQGTVAARTVAQNAAVPAIPGRESADPAQSLQREPVAALPGSAIRSRMIRSSRGGIAMHPFAGICVV